MPDVLFVYGSLRSEFDNPHTDRLRREAVSLGHATVRGTMFRVGEYPGYRPEPDGIVHGELWQMKDAERTLSALDAYEGEEYVRIEIAVEEPPGRAWIYQYLVPIEAERRIASGDFLAP